MTRMREQRSIPKNNLSLNFIKPLFTRGRLAEQMLCSRNETLQKASEKITPETYFDQALSAEQA